jgi:hypothetical protein
MPFHFYQTSDVLAGTYHWSKALVLLAAVVVLTAISYIGFRSRDLS